MRIFVTGASGFVGSAVTAELLANGHEVIGLARSDSNAEKLQKAGATPLRGSLAEPQILATAARDADATMHLAFIHDFSNFAASAEADRQAITAMGDALAGSGKVLVVTSGIGLLSPGKLLTEDDLPNPSGHGRLSEASAMAFADKGVKLGLVRLPPSVHGDHDHGFVPTLIDIARKKGVSAYVESGDNRWSTVHVTDAAKVYRRIVETGATETRYHPVAEEGIAFRDIAQTIGDKLGLPTVSVSAQDAPAHFGWMANFAQLDIPASSQKTRQALNWTPTGVTLLDDLKNGLYFEAGQTGIR